MDGDPHESNGSNLDKQMEGQDHPFETTSGSSSGRSVSRFGQGCSLPGFRFWAEGVSGKYWIPEGISGN